MRALLQQTDRLIKTVPEVEHVFGRAGRAETATDPAPFEMLETTIRLKPRKEWRPGMTPEKLREELNRAVEVPGLANTWVPPIKTRIDKNLDYQDRAREVAEKYVRPRAAELDRTGEYGWGILEALKSYHLTGIWIPEEYGGQGTGVLDICLVVEQLSRACGGVGVAYAGNALGSFPIVLGGTHEQKQKYLPPIAAGDALIAFGLSEKASGSDAGSLRTTATRDGASYILNGHKKWNTNGAVASTFTVYALTDPDKGMRGISAFILDKGTPGFSVGKREDTMGSRTVPVNELDFVDCRVPASQLVGGKEGGGFRNAMMTLDRARPGVAAQALGLAQGALEWALRYASERSSPRAATWTPCRAGPGPSLPGGPSDASSASDWSSISGARSCGPPPAG